MITKHQITKIDAVIPWVDGNDINWQKKINQYAETKINFSNKKESVRFNSIGEITICIKSIIKNVAFVDTIFLVTDQQMPHSFNELETLAKASNIKLKIIDHSVLFNGFEDFLPCFNSCSIECLFFNIPNISEHFLIFNDDFFVMRKTSIEDFFINNKPVVRGKWKKFNENRYFRNLYHNILYKLNIPKKEKTSSFKQLQQTSAKIASIPLTKKYLRRLHTPSSVRKNSFLKIFKDKEILTNNIKYKFRHKDQFIASSLSEHVEISNNSFFYKKNTQLTYFRSYKNFLIIKLKLFWFTINRNKIFITCQSLEMANIKTQNYILNWLNKKLE